MFTQPQLKLQLRPDISASVAAAAAWARAVTAGQRLAAIPDVAIRRIASHIGHKAWLSFARHPH